MPVVRFSRDKRGYEYVYLVHTPTRRGKPGRTRILYWYRTPPGVRIGRKPFDEEVQRTVEQQNPGVTFDWPSIITAEMPPPDQTDFWRERRRLEKAARQERRAAEAEESGDVSESEAPEPMETLLIGPQADVAESEPELSAESSTVAATAGPVADGPDGPEGAQASPAQKKRRRRRGGRRRKSAAGAADSGEAGQSGAAAGTSGDDESEPAGDDPSE